MTYILLHAVIIYGLCLPLRVTEDGRSSKGLFEFLTKPCNCRCGVPNRGARILGGEVLRGYEFPWLAPIQIKGARSVQGTLINSKYVVTSASLLMGLTPYDVKVTLGLFDRCYSDVSSTNYSIESIILHPEYSPTDGAHDIGLLKLNGEVNFEKRVSPICLAIPGTSYIGQVGTVVGWLDPAEGKQGSSCRPRKMGLPILGRRECFGTVPDMSHFSGDKGCLGVVGATSGICKTDAGGPVMYRDYDGLYELVGILSHKNFCGGRPATAIYTTIKDHIPWLKRSTDDGCYCYKF